MTHSTQPPPYKVPRGLQGLTDKELETFYREMTRAVYLMWENQSGSTNKNTPAPSDEFSRRYALITGFN
jgi:hypothetical protein|tara:strand:+ start:10122 stop:10328 length:207 start_codon:yes stop_codon:yes gene_type:complete